MLSFLNRIFVRLQRWMQGIPGGPAHLYDKIVTKYLEPSYGYVVKEIEGKASKNLTIVEVGCGAGKLLFEITNRVKPKDVLGLDISHAMARISKRNLIKNGMYPYVNLVLADAHEMPIKEGCFDLVVSTGTLHHIKKPAEFFKECSRILKKSGEAWIYEFSHDAECEESSKTLKRPCFLLKTLAALHGLPRSTFERGYIKEALENSRCKNMIRYNGVITKLILYKNDLSNGNALR